MDDAILVMSSSNLENLASMSCINLSSLFYISLGEPSEASVVLFLPEIYFALLLSWVSGKYMSCNWSLRRVPSSSPYITPSLPPCLMLLSTCMSSIMTVRVSSGCFVAWLVSELYLVDLVGTCFTELNRGRSCCLRTENLCRTIMSYSRRSASEFYLTDLMVLLSLLRLWLRSST